MEGDEEEDRRNTIPETELLTTVISILADIIYNFLHAISSPFIALISTIIGAYRRAEATTSTVETAVLRLPPAVTRRSASMLRKVGLGFIGAANLCIVLTMVMMLAVLLGVSLVQFWVEDPVFVKQKVFFDYTDPHPNVELVLHGITRMKQPGIPTGHIFQVSLRLLMPESDYNLHIGVFQITAELLSGDGEVMMRSSQPCMLRFRSLPVRLFRTVIMCVPLVLGILEESQRLTLQVLKHKEGYERRSSAIRITMIPRAGTSSLPQLYEAEMIVKSQLPWKKQIVRNWKWTFCVWVSLFVFSFLLPILLLCFRSQFFPKTVNLKKKNNNRQDINQESSSTSRITSHQQTESQSSCS